MRQNAARRAALLDAAIEVLARDGARGLTFRAIDAEAAVPMGTASNYFPNRTALLVQAGAHVHRRLAPTQESMEQLLALPPTRPTVRRAVHELLDRVTADRVGYLALLELRLEATRRPEVRAEVTAVLAGEVRANIRFHLDHGYPGDEGTVTALYLAMTGLLVEHLTAPDAWGSDDVPALVDMIVDRIVPDE